MPLAPLSSLSSLGLNPNPVHLRENPIRLHNTPHSAINCEPTLKMYLPSISSSLLAISALTLAGLSPVSTMVIDVNVNTDTSLRTQDPFNALVSCGFPSGNCYDNDCDGEKGKNADTCTNGKLAVCLSIIT